MEQPHAQVCCVHGPRSSGHLNATFHWDYSGTLLYYRTLSSERTSGKSVVHFFVSNYSGVGNKHDLSGSICSDIRINHSVLR